MNKATIDTVKQVLDDQGGQRHGCEAVSQREHALQCVSLAERSGASPASAAAALLHDIGHLVDPDVDTTDAEGQDIRHEATGARRVSQLFGDNVPVPIRLHVAAKRYLTAVEPDYMAKLSPQSVRSLELQGGPFSEAEAERFIAAPHAKEAVLLRRWDELAKDPDAVTPGLDHFVPILEACAAQNEAS